MTSARTGGAGCQILRRSSGLMDAYDRQIAAAVEAVDFQDHWITRFTFDIELRFRTGRSTWPMLTRFDARLLIGCWTREVDLVGRPASELIVWTMLIVPGNSQAKFSLEFHLILGQCDLS